MIATGRWLWVLVGAVGCSSSPLGSAINPPAGADAAAVVPDASGVKLDANASSREASGPDAAVVAGDRPRDAAGLSNGQACSSAGQCRSNFCVDGVCCGDSCSGLCVACNVPGSLGTCVPIAAGQDPGDECQLLPAATCGLDGFCDGRGACRRHVSGTECSAPTCAAEMATSRGTCDGAGTCQPGTTRTCGGYLCDGNVCRTTCTVATDCNEAFTCTAGACVRVKIAGLIVFDADNADGWSAQANFQPGPTGAHPWSDRPSSYVAAVDGTVSMALVGKEWIQVADASRKYSGGPQATLSLAAAADVYLLIDDRWTDRAWATGWTDTGAKIRIWESVGNPALPFSVYVKKAQTESVDLPAVDGAASAYDSFAVVD